MPHRSQLDDLLSALASEGAALHRAEIVARFGRKAFAQAVREGRITHVVAHYYSLAQHARAPQTRAVAALAWLAPESALSGLAACALHGVSVRSILPMTIVINRRHRIRTPQWLRARHRSEPLPTTLVKGMQVVNLPHALVQAWWDAGPQVGRGVILDAIRDDLTSAQQILEGLGHYRHLPNRRALVAFLEQLRDGVDSYLEWIADQTVLNTADLRQLERQKTLWVDGIAYRVDAFDSQTRTAIEFDGARYHNDDRARRRDIARDRALATIGVVVLRFTFEEITHDPEGCRRAIRNAIASRGAALQPVPRGI